MQEVLNFIKRHRLEEPTQWMIEAHRPLRAIAYNSLLLVQPAAVFMGLGSSVKSLLECLDSPENFSKLEQALNRESNSKDDGAQALACDDPS